MTAESPSHRGMLLRALTNAARKENQAEELPGIRLICRGT